VTHSTSPPSQRVLADLPHVFVDRSLGALQLPRLLRAAGVQLTTMREHYGEQLSQATEDPDWIG
jgi:PIN like domain